jgi:hypothetical protein
MDLGIAVGAVVGTKEGIMGGVVFKAEDAISLHLAAVDLKHLMMGSNWIRISWIKCLRSSELLFTKDANLCVPQMRAQAPDLSPPWVQLCTTMLMTFQLLLMVKLMHK